VTPAPPRRPSRLAYLGTPQLAVPPLRALVEAGWDVGLVVSAPDRRRGRGSALAPSPVKSAALDLGLPVADDPDALLDAACDLGVVVAYGRIIRPHLLERMPFVNLHVSLLPRWRGAAPIERAVLVGDERTGVCLMAVEEGLDTGGVYARAETDVDRKSVEDLRSELIDAGTELLLDALTNGFGEPEPQVGEVTYAEKLRPEELHIDWSAPAEQVDRVVRVGGAWTTVGGRRLKVHAVEPLADPVDEPNPRSVMRGATELSHHAGQNRDGGSGAVPGTLRGTVVTCGEGVVELREVQPEGKAAMPADAWRRGAGASVERLGT